MSKKIILALMATSLFLSSCGVFTNIQSTGISGGTEGDFEAVTEVAAFPFSVPDNAQSLDFNLSIQVEEGSVVWRLKTPTGGQVMGGQLLAGESVDETRSFEAIPGEWLVEMEYFAAKGEYDLGWRTR